MLIMKNYAFNCFLAFALLFSTACTEDETTNTRTEPERLSPSEIAILCIGDSREDRLYSH